MRDKQHFMMCATKGVEDALQKHSRASNPGFEGQREGVKAN